MWHPWSDLTMWVEDCVLSAQESYPNFGLKSRGVYEETKPKIQIIRNRIEQQKQKRISSFTEKKSEKIENSWPQNWSTPSEFLDPIRRLSEPVSLGRLLIFWGGQSLNLHPKKRPKKRGFIEAGKFLSREINGEIRIKLGKSRTKIPRVAKRFFSSFFVS